MHWTARCMHSTCKFWRQDETRQRGLTSGRLCMHSTCKFWRQDETRQRGLTSGRLCMHSTCKFWRQDETRQRGLTSGRLPQESHDISTLKIQPQHCWSVPWGLRHVNEKCKNFTKPTTAEFLELHAGLGNQEGSKPWLQFTLSQVDQSLDR